MRHTWRDLTFLHWPIPVEALRPLIPLPLQIETFDGQAWIGVIPFSMSFRLRNMPLIPLVSTFAEINVRTYVRLHDTPGVWFLSLDCSNCIVAKVARVWYGLQYFTARTLVESNQDAIRYSSCRWADQECARFEAQSRPEGERFHSKQGTLAHWLTERYCLYAIGRNSKLLRAKILHAPWELQEADVILHTNTMGEAHGIKLPDTAPIAHFAKLTNVLVWPPEKLHVE